MNEIAKHIIFVEETSQGNGMGRVQASVISEHSGVLLKFLLLPPPGLLRPSANTLLTRSLTETLDGIAAHRCRRRTC